MLVGLLAAAAVAMPLQSLRGFERILLKAGEQRRVAFRLTPVDDLGHYDVASKAFAVEPGEYKVRVGASSRDIRLTGHLHVQ